jgi:hypothetical protein
MRMRRRIIVVFVIVAIASSAILLTVPRGSPDVAISGSLTREDVGRIREVLSRERAPLFAGKFAAKGGAETWRRLRERFAGKLRSITAVDSQYIRAEFGDRWNAGITYEYELRREGKDWIVVGIGYLFESDRLPSAVSRILKGEMAGDAVNPRP